MEPGHHDPMIYKAMGSLIGTVAGLVYIKPRNLRDAISRTFVSLAAGMLYYFVPIDYFGWDYDNEKTLAGAALVAFVSWPLAGLVFKMLADKTRIGGPGA